MDDKFYESTDDCLSVDSVTKHINVDLHLAGTYGVIEMETNHGPPASRNITQYMLVSISPS